MAVTKDPYAKLRPKGRAPLTVYAVIETPAGSRNKYKWDEALHVFRLHKRLPLGARFPFDFGFVPGTLAGDGDPIDVLVVDPEPTFAGCIVPVRLLGVIEARELTRGKPAIRNDRLIATAETDKIHPHERTFDDLAPGLLDQLEHFFASYNVAEGRRFEVLGRRGPEAAARAVAVAARAARPKP